jgi:hypothetical protein
MTYDLVHVLDDGTLFTAKQRPGECRLLLRTERGARLL